MEPMDDRELKSMLEEWKAPPAPARLRESIFPSVPWWKRVWRAEIRIPVPVAVCLLVVILPAAWRLSSYRPAPPQEQVKMITFRELQPVKELKPRIIRRHYEQ